MTVGRKWPFCLKVILFHKCLKERIANAKVRIHLVKKYKPV